MKEARAQIWILRHHIVISIWLAAASIALPAHAHNSSMYLWGFGSPIIDGTLSPDEWSRAAQVQFMAQVPEGGATPATLFMLNDAASVYLAFVIQRPNLDSLSRVFVLFDADHNGAFLEESEDALIVFLSAVGTSFFDTHLTDCLPAGRGCTLRNDPIQDGQAASSNDGTHTVIEISHPLRSAEPLFDLQLDPGNVAGVLFDLILSSPTREAFTRLPARLMGDIAVTSPTQARCAPLADPTGDTPTAGIDIREVRVSDDGASLAADVFLAGNIPSSGATIRLHMDADCNTGQVECGTTTSDFTLTVTTRRGNFLSSGPAAAVPFDTDIDTDQDPDAVHWELPLAMLEPGIDTNGDGVPDVSDPNPSHVCFFADSKTGRRLAVRADQAPDLRTGNTSTKPCFEEEICRFTRSLVPTHLATVPSGAIIELEEDTGLSRIAVSTGFDSLSDLALSPDGKSIFVSLGFGQGGAGSTDGRILKIDRATRDVSVLGDSGFHAVPALTFTPDGTLFGVGATGFANNNPEDYFLITLDQTSGLGTFVNGRIGVNFVESLAPHGSLLVGTGFDRGGFAVFAMIDPLTGLGEIVGNLGFDFVAGISASRRPGFVGSLGGFDADGGGLVQIDPDSGKAELKARTVYRAISGLAKLPE